MNQAIAKFLVVHYNIAVEDERNVVYKSGGREQERGGRLVYLPNTVVVYVFRNKSNKGSLFPFPVQRRPQFAHAKTSITLLKVSRELVEYSFNAPLCEEEVSKQAFTFVFGQML